MLVVNSFGLQDALEKSSVDIGHFFSRCHSAAVACATIVKDELGPRGFLRYSPDSHFVQCSYALLSLLKVRGVPLSLGNEKHDSNLPMRNSSHGQLSVPSLSVRRTPWSLFRRLLYYSNASQLDHFTPQPCIARSYGLLFRSKVGHKMTAATLPGPIPTQSIRTISVIESHWVRRATRLETAWTRI